MLWGMIVFFGFMLIRDDRMLDNGFYIGITLFGLVWFFLNSFFMHYFQVSKNFLVVRNHNRIWKRKAYRINNIQEVVFETKQKWPNCLRVITKDFKTSLYPAGTLTDKTWLQLKDRLERNQLIVNSNFRSVFIISVDRVYCHD